MTSASGATEALAAFAAALDLRDVPPEARERAKQCLVDLIGIIALAGSQAESSAAFRAAVRRLAGPGGPATVVGEPKSWPYHYAALLNGTLGHSLDFDDTNIRGVLHPGVTVIPAALAAAQMRGASGREFLAAVVAGYEVACRVGAALGLAAYDRGFHPTAVAGIFGATAAAARLLGLGAAGLVDAFGLSLSQAAGSMQYLENGAWNKRLHPGLAAHDAIVSAVLSQEGVRGAARPLEGRYGLVHAYSNGEGVGRLTEGLGEQWAIAGTGLKPYPSCRFTHAAIDALLRIRRDAEVLPGEVQEVSIRLSPKAYDIVGEPQPRKVRPENVVDGQFSMYFQAAAALSGGTVTWDSYRRPNTR